MGRKAVFDLLEPATQARALAFVRANRHRTVDDIRAGLLEAEGVDISRTSLHRAITKIHARDQFIARKDEQTIITVVNRVSGEVHVIKTCLPGALLEALIRQAETQP